MTAKKQQLLIAETFLSVQGEGKLSGKVSFFIRLSGCNLRCVWCDTPYASWDPHGETRTVESVLREAHASGVQHMVITGGEPMLFAEIEELTRALHHAGHHITIETAGTVFQNVACDLMSISPKLSNSTPLQDPAWNIRHEERRINISVLQQLIDRHPARQIKFVITSEDDLNEIDDLLSQLKYWSADDVLLMPEGTEPPHQSRREMVMRICAERGWRFCLRLHLELFGNVRGT